jgi:hypothetical protein
LKITKKTFFEKKRQETRVNIENNVTFDKRIKENFEEMTTKND